MANIESITSVGVLPFKPFMSSNMSARSLSLTVQASNNFALIASYLFFWAGCSSISSPWWLCYFPVMQRRANTVVRSERYLSLFSSVHFSSIYVSFWFHCSSSFVFSHFHYSLSIYVFVLLSFPSSA